MYFVHYETKEFTGQAGPFGTSDVAEQFALALANKHELRCCEINKEDHHNKPR